MKKFFFLVFGIVFMIGLVVLVNASEIGSPAIDRSTSFPQIYTVILLDNPATESGNITSVSIWGLTTASDVEVGSFNGSGTSYTSRDFRTVSVTGGEMTTINGLEISILSGDYIGILVSEGMDSLERDLSGYAGIYYKSGSQFGVGTQVYTLASGNTVSVNATITADAEASTSQQTHISLNGNDHLQIAGGHLEIRG